MGGRYRIRAWYPDWYGQELSLPHAQIVFLAEEEKLELQLDLAIDTDPPIDGDIKVYLTADPEPALDPSGRRKDQPCLRNETSTMTAEVDRVCFLRQR